MNSYERVYKTLINEVGDTSKGREKIQQALHNRRVDLDIAKSVQKDNPLGARGQTPHQLAKLVRGAAQGAKVAAYVKGRKEGGSEGAMKGFRRVKKKYVRDTAKTERDFGGGVPDLNRTGEPAGAGVRTATRNMTYRNRQIKRQLGLGEATGAKGNPSASRVISTPKKKAAGSSDTERPPQSHIQALQDKVNKYYKKNPDAEGAEGYSKKGKSWNIPPR